MEAVRMQFHKGEKFWQLKNIIAVLEIVFKPLYHVLVLEEHAKILKEFTELQYHLSVHMSESFIDILPQLGQKVFILIQYSLL
jgi:hypothetical protein